MGTDGEILTRARRLASGFAERSEEIEALGRLPDDVARAMGEAGFYRLFAPAAYGGLEADPHAAAEVYETLAEGDAAAAWVAFIGATTSLAMSRLPEDGVREMLADPAALASGVFAATGRAERVHGGFRVSGRWEWGSGSMNAAFVGGGCMIIENGQPALNSVGTPRNHMMFMRADEVVSLDTWQVSGLCGTGSTAFEARDVFVPERRAAGYLVRKSPDRPLYRFPGFSPLAQGVGAVGLGIARASLEAFRALASARKRVGSSAPLADRSYVQAEVARAEARLRAARDFFYGALDRAWVDAVRGEPERMEHIRDMRLSVIHAMNESAAVVDAMYALAGGAAIHRSAPLQRHLRDVRVATQHAMVSPALLEPLGRLYLGVETSLAGL